MRRRSIKIHRDDDVEIALDESWEGVPAGHKFATRAIPQGDFVRKYGHIVGRATEDITTGAWIHTHNLASTLSSERTYRYQPVPSGRSRLELDFSFSGYRRSDGRVGVRNELWIIPTVGCVNRVVLGLERMALDAGLAGVHAVTHPFGCSQLGDDLADTRSILAALGSHPNAGAVLFVGLGCENNQLQSLLQSVRGRSGDRVAYFNAQEVDDEYAVGLHELSQLHAKIRADKRSRCSSEDLIIGVNCGGSDSLSGITANPLVGMITDALTASGGSTVLTEVPEMFGAEQQLMDRCTSREIFDRLVAMIRDFKQYFVDHHQPVYENPSPGNRAGGITTLEEKSLGAIQKGGQAPVVDILKYGQRLDQRGLNLLEAPGNDAVSSTALIAAGAQLLLFTTGRGTPLGFPVPTLKISSNTELFRRKRHWIDFDAGSLVRGGHIDHEATELASVVQSIASGEQASLNEQTNQREIAIWKRGVTL